MSILRSSKYFRQLFIEKRGPSSRASIIGQLVSKPHSILLLSRCISGTSINRNRIETVETAIEKLDRSVRRIGRISKNELYNVFQDIKKTGRATSTQSLFVIRCCGSLVPEESPEARSKLVKEVWDTFANLGVQLDISHYNALLSVYIENQFDFSPTDFMKKLEAMGIEPNRVTYQRLVAACCNKGDVEAATDILQIMKEKQVPINEAVFNSLITGHAHGNDMESAVGILSVMKQAGVEPTTETYTALLCGYAINGDIDSICRTLDECVTKEIDIGDRELLEIAYTLAANGHSDHLDKIFSRLKKSFNFAEDAKTICIRLITSGHSASVFKILKTMVDPTYESDPLQRGNFLIQHAFYSKWPLEKILSLCEEMKSSGYNVYSYFVAAEACLLRGDTENSYRLLSMLAEKDTVPQHCFWPLLVQYGKLGRFEDIVKTLKLALNAGDQPISGETLKDYVCPYLGSGNKIEGLRVAGIPLGTSASAMVGHLLAENDIQKAAKFASNYRANYNNATNRRLLFQAFFQTNDVESLVALVLSFSDNDDDPNAFPGGVALSLIRNKKEIAEEVLSAYLSAGIVLLPEHAEAIKEAVGDDSPQVSDILSKLTSSDLKRTTVFKPTVQKRPGEKDERTLLRAIEGAEARGESSAVIKRQLLLYYCHNKELEKAVALKEELEKDGLVMQPGLLVLFMDLYCHHNMLNEALEYYKKACESEKLQLDASKSVKLAALLCANDRFQEALDLINSHPQSSDEVADNTAGHLTLSWKLLNTCAEKKNSDWVDQMFDALVNNNFIEPNNIFLGPLVKVHLLKDDLDKAMQKFEECCVKYRATPWKNELTCRLIQKEDAAALQKVADLSTQIHGEVNSLFDLVISFVECHKVKQARKILETPGLHTKTQRISSACRRFYNYGEIDNLKTLLEVTKGFTHINRAEIFHYLLLSYIKTDDVDQAYALWTQMQEEDIKPSDEFMIALGMCLKKHNRPVPFLIPTTVSSVSNLITNSVKPVPPAVKQFRKALYARDVDEALQVKSDIPDGDLTKADLSRLSSLLVSNGRIGEASKLLTNWLENGYRPDISCLSFVINAVAKLGDVDSMKNIGNHLSPELRKLVSFSNRYAHCMTEAGRAAEVVEELKNEIEKAQTPEDIANAAVTFPRGGIFSIFQIAPELLPQVEELAELYKEKGILDPLNQLWVHYMLSNNTEKAQNAWEQLKNKDRIMFMPIIKQARKTLDLNLLEKLLDLFKASSLNSYAIGAIYSSMFDVLLTQDKIDECEKRLEEALNVCKMDHFNIAILKKLKNNVEQSGRNFKYEIPVRRQRDDDSSSSSDSDAEDVEKGNKRELV